MKIEENPALVTDAPPEEELLKRASAPTVRDLRAWAKDLLKTIETETELTSPNDRLPHRED
jgi:hypothetical protein